MECNNCSLLVRGNSLIFARVLSFFVPSIQVISVLLAQSQEVEGIDIVFEITGIRPLLQNPDEN